MKSATTAIHPEKCYGCTRSRLLPDLMICLLISSCFCSVCAFAQTRTNSDAVDQNNSQGQSDPGPGTHIDRKRLADPQLLAFLDKMDAAGVLSPGNVRELRKAYPFYASLAGPAEQVFGVTDKQIPGPAGEIPIRLYYPRAGGALPMWIFFHGGGFVTGSLETHDTPLRALANRCDCLVVAIAYRLAPEHPFPAAPDDAYAATKWVAENAVEIGGDPHRIAVGGDGAGGNLAAVVALMARDRGGPHLILQVLIYPILDANMGTVSHVVSRDPLFNKDCELSALGAYVPFLIDFNDPQISPVDAKSLRDLPAALIVVGKDDPVRDEVDMYARRLNAAGVSVGVSDYPNGIHRFFLLAGALDAGKRAIDEISAGLRQAFQNGN